MARFARTSESIAAEYVNVSRPFSNFEFIDSRFGGKIFPPIRRIMSQVRQHCCKTMVVEELDLNLADDLLEENEDIRIRLPEFYKSIAFRYSFFTEKLSTKHDLYAVTPDSFLGYAIIKCDEIPKPYSGIRVYESVIRPSCHIDNYMRGANTWECNVEGRSFYVSGYLYAQQNNATNTCAHVALRTVAARFHKDGDISYREINRLTGIPDKGIPPIDHRIRKAGGPDGKGLYPEEMKNILSSIGANYFLAQYSTFLPDKSPPPFTKYLYGSIESGYPAIVGFETGKSEHHAVPVFGHTFNADAWVHNAEWSYFKIGPRTAYIPSDSWLGAFIAHDDNWGSNFSIPRNFLQTRRFCDKLPAGESLCQMESRCVTYVIGTFPRDVTLSSIGAELIGVDYLTPLLHQLPNRNLTWINRLQRYLINNLLVFRPVLITSSDYLNHLKTVSDWERNKISDSHLRALEKILVSGKRFWMIEMSVPELFSANRRKIAEILIQTKTPSYNQRDFSNLLLARLPGWFAIPPKNTTVGSPFNFIPSQVQTHVELFGCEELKNIGS